jgi:nitrogen regulatory protein PII-like uncharacterized protein|tara:strand:- start:404 stop:604 length:201 start_codon:yes stop_codon:yes gene_type:complete
MLLIVMSTSEPEGWTISEYKSFHVTNDSESSVTDSDDEEEQIFAKSSVVRKTKYKKIVEKEELLPE